MLKHLALALLLVSGLSACRTVAALPDGPMLGVAPHKYVWDPGWLQTPDGGELGNTHGEVVVDRRGRLYVNTDTERAVMIFDRDGRFLSAWGAEFRKGLHGMTIVEEGGDEFLYFVHTGRHEFAKSTLEGEILWRRGHPEASGVYASAEDFRPTDIAVAPDGRIFVADGYGKNRVHLYDRDVNYLRSIGSPGSEPGQFKTAHGICIDTRRGTPELLVADRDNGRLQRYTLDGDWLGIIEGPFRRPCKIQQQGEYLVLPDLAGRVTIIDGANELVCHLGDNPDESLRANNGVKRDRWVDGLFLAPHSAAWDADGNLFVMDWNHLGRITRLQRVPAP